MAKESTPEKIFKLIPEVGKHLADSRNTIGAKRGTYLDDITNKPCGAGEFIEISKSDLSDGNGISTEGVVALVSLAIAAGYGIAKAAPHIKKWVSDSAVPWIKIRYKKILETTATAKSRLQKMPAKKESDAVVLDEEVFYVEHGETMTSAQARKELIDAFILILCGYKKANRVSNADVILPSGEIVAGNDLLLNQSIIDQLNDALIDNPKLLTEQQLLDLSEVLGYQVVREGMFIPITAAAISNAIGR